MQSSRYAGLEGDDWHAPNYIAELCFPAGTQTGRRALRSASRNDLILPSFRTTSRARRDFSIAEPRILKALSPSVRATNGARDNIFFSRLLKTHFSGSATTRLQTFRLQTFRLQVYLYPLGLINRGRFLIVSLKRAKYSQESSF